MQNNLSSAPDLQGLRDIHLPDPIGFWPPSGGIVFLLLLLVISTLLVLFLFRHQLKQKALKRAALKALKQIERQSLPQDKRLKALATLTRRVALSRFEPTEVAPLTGQAWLTFLDRRYDESGHANLFREGPGQWLGDARYLPDSELHANTLNELHLLIKKWIERVC